MANGSPFGVNFLYLVFILVPGYASLRGYLGATVQLDTVSRFDKLLLSAVGGTLTLAVSLAGYRTGLVEWTWQRLSAPPGNAASIGSDPLPVSIASSTSVSATVASVVGLSSLGYVLGYTCGTAVHVWNGRERSEQDLEQPWETVVKQSVPMDEVVVVTREGERIRGRLYRIGSPSEDYDLLLFGAERNTGDETIPIGMSYHHYRDVARVQFPGMQQGPVDEEANTLVKLCVWGKSGLQSWMSRIANSVRSRVGRVYKSIKNINESNEGTDDD